MNTTINQRLRAVLAQIPPKQRADILPLLDEVAALEARAITDETKQEVFDLAESLGLHPRDFSRWIRRSSTLTGVWMLDKTRVSITAPISCLAISPDEEDE